MSIKKEDFSYLWIGELLTYVETTNIKYSPFYEDIEEVWSYQGNYYMLKYRLYRGISADTIMLQEDFDVIDVAPKLVVREVTEWVEL